MVGKLVVVTALMFGFGYALVPIYRAICEALGINVLSRAERAERRRRSARPANTQVDLVAHRHGRVRRQRARPVGLQAGAGHARRPSGRADDGDVRVPQPPEPDAWRRRRSRATRRSMAMAHFKKLECFCFTEHVLKPGESKQWPVVFVIDPKLPKDVTTITLSYTFFEVGGKMPAEPRRLAAPARAARRRRHDAAATTCRDAGRRKASLAAHAAGGGLVVLRRAQVGATTRRTSSELNPVHVIVAGVVGAALFVRALIAARATGSSAAASPPESQRRSRISEIGRRTQHVGSDPHGPHALLLRARAVAPPGAWRRSACSS